MDRRGRFFTFGTDITHRSRHGYRLERYGRDHERVSTAFLAIPILAAAALVAAVYLGTEAHDALFNGEDPPTAEAPTGQPEPGSITIPEREP